LKFYFLVININCNTCSSC